MPFDQQPEIHLHKIMWTYCKDGALACMLITTTSSAILKCGKSPTDFSVAWAQPLSVLLKGWFSTSKFLNQALGSGNGIPGLRTWLCCLLAMPGLQYWYSDQIFLDPYYHFLSLPLPLQHTLQYAFLFYQSDCSS